MTTPDHLKPIEPASAVEALCERLATEIPAHHYTVVEEFHAFRETCTPHDGRRLANALRHVLKRPDLAAEVEALLARPGAAPARHGGRAPDAAVRPLGRRPAGTGARGDHLGRGVPRRG